MGVMKKATSPLRKLLKSRPEVEGVFNARNRRDRTLTESGYLTFYTVAAFTQH